MLFSRSWILDHVELGDDDAQLLPDRLTQAGLAVEGEEAHGDDVVYDIDVTTNRPDAMNHLGLAREASVLFERPLRLPEVTLSEVSPAASSTARLVVESFEDCPRYTVLVIRNVTVGPSPEWLVKRLEAIGSRSINNVVDITNYVLWETGQPMHAFDLERIEPGAEVPEVRIRRAQSGEQLKTLDGEERKLDPEILVIANSKEPIALGGIMGGFDSEVTEETRHVFLECAHFGPSVVRRGAKQLGMHTDASHRYERGADPEACLWAAQRAAALMVELAGGEVLEGHLEEKQLSSEWPPQVEVDPARLLAFGGVEISREEMERVLEGLGFQLDDVGSGRWQVTAPSWRYYDFENVYPADVYEEVLRIHGLDDVPATLPQIGGTDAPERVGHTNARTIRDTLAAAGFAEAIHFGFYDRTVDETYPSLYGDRPALPLANPLSDRYALMRRSLLPHLVESAYYNQRRGATSVRLFEVGHIFASEGADRHVEQEVVSVVLGGSVGSPWEREVKLDFFDLKGALEQVFEALGVEVEARPASIHGLVEGASAELYRPGHAQPVGYLGELSQDEVPFALFVAEVATESLLISGEIDLTTQTPSRFPGIALDSTLTHSLDVPWGEIHRAIEALAIEDLVQITLKDRYRGKGVPEGAVNTTIAFLYNAEGRSLTQEEVNERHQQVVSELDGRFAWNSGS